MARNVSSARVPTFSLGERIRKVRADLGLSQQQFADMLGVHRKTLNNWETGKHKPSYGDLMLMANTADVSLKWLAGEQFRPPIDGSTSAADNDQRTRPDTREYRPSVLAA